MLPVSEGGMSATEIDKVFDRYTPYGILGNLTATEVVEKIKVWEQKNEQPKCELANCICPYEIDCDECEVFCSVGRARQRAKERAMKEALNRQVISLHRIKEDKNSNVNT